MALTKLVNGVRIAVSDAEEANIRAEWNANETAIKAQEAKDLRERLIDERMQSIAHNEAERQLIEAGTIE